MSTPPLQEGRDYTIENGLYVFTAFYLRQRGFCCRSGCRNCPYGFSSLSMGTPGQEVSRDENSDDTSSSF
jgi:hypothetical protein